VPTAAPGSRKAPRLSPVVRITGCSSGIGRDHAQQLAQSDHRCAHRPRLVLHSHTPDGGVIFSDGVEADYLAFNAGAVATIGVAERKAQLVVKG
jgi:NAD(P)-dependent dehydrogenase (short-subunit alcohol dehydrogenase family)